MLNLHASIGPGMLGQAGFSSKIAIQNFNMKYLVQAFLVFIMLLANNSNAIAQNNPYYTTEAEVIEAAYEALDNSMAFGGALNGYKNDYGWTGTYTFNITLKGKGEVVEVSSAGSNGSFQVENQLKGILEEMTFPFKMPQDSNYKFKYEFKF